MRRLGHPQLSSGDHTVTHRYRGGILAHNCKALFYCALQLGGKKTSLEITFPCSQRGTLRQVETRCCSDEHERAASLLGMLFTNPESPGWQLRWNHEKSWNFEMYLDGTMIYNVIPGVIPLREMASVSKENNGNQVPNSQNLPKSTLHREPARRGASRRDASYRNDLINFRFRPYSTRAGPRWRTFSRAKLPQITITITITILYYTILYYTILYYTIL